MCVSAECDGQHARYPQMRVHKLVITGREGRRGSTVDNLHNESAEKLCEGVCLCLHVLRIFTDIPLLSPLINVTGYVRGSRLTYLWVAKIYSLLKSKFFLCA